MHRVVGGVMYVYRSLSMQEEGAYFFLDGEWRGHSHGRGAVCCVSFCLTLDTPCLPCEGNRAPYHCPVEVVYISLNSGGEVHICCGCLGFTIYVMYVD